MKGFLNNKQRDFLEESIDRIGFKNRKRLNEIEDECYGKILVTKNKELMLYTSLPFLLSKNKIDKNLLQKLWFDSCDKCSTTTGRISVPSGCLCPEIFIIGMAPSVASTRNKIPYRAISFSATGSHIRKVLYELELIHKVWYTNIVKCSIAFNQIPEEDEVKNCSFWLKEELRILKPKKIICLGNFAYKWFTENFVLKYPMFLEGEFQDSIYKIYHPSYFARKGFGYKKYYDHVKEVLGK